MIGKDEILAFADETGLTPNVVEKDYVLGWLLAAINSNPVLSQSWVFKGGTCLKKCYFETYRFSEDLDFTLREQSQINETVLKEQFVSISDWLYEETGIEIPSDRHVFDIYANPGGGQSCQGRVYYRSYFSKGKHSLPRIKKGEGQEICMMSSICSEMITCRHLPLYRISFRKNVVIKG